jgi:hypothetical protein
MDPWTLPRRLDPLPDESLSGYTPRLAHPLEHSAGLLRQITAIGEYAERLASRIDRTRNADVAA